MQAQIKRKVNGDGASKFAKEENQLVLRDFLLLLLLPLSTLLSVGVSVESGTAVAVRYPPNPRTAPTYFSSLDHFFGDADGDDSVAATKYYIYLSLFWGVG